MLRHLINHLAVTSYFDFKTTGAQQKTSGFSDGMIKS